MPCCGHYKILGLYLMDENNVLKNRHPDARKASSRIHQRASRAEGPCVYFQKLTLFVQLSLAPDYPRPRLTIFASRLTLCVSSKRFAILLRHFRRAIIRLETGYAGARTPNAALTTNHLLQKGDPWLTQILAVCRSRTSTISSTVSTHHSHAFIAIWKHWNRSAFSTHS
jgi:hypothetical protein